MGPFRIGCLFVNCLDNYTDTNYLVIFVVYCLEVVDDKVHRSNKE